MMLLSYEIMKTFILVSQSYGLSRQSLSCRSSSFFNNIAMLLHINHRLLCQRLLTVDDICSLNANAVFGRASRDMGSTEELGKGFCKKLYALQGRRNTFYTGHAWAGDYSSMLWQFTKGILAGMFEQSCIGEEID
jgi:hypothetical protein